MNPCHCKISRRVSACAEDRATVWERSGGTASTSTIWRAGVERLGTRDLAKVPLANGPLLHFIALYYENNLVGACRGGVLFVFSLRPSDLLWPALCFGCLGSLRIKPGLPVLPLLLPTAGRFLRPTLGRVWWLLRASCPGTLLLSGGPRGRQPVRAGSVLRIPRLSPCRRSLHLPVGADHGCEPCFPCLVSLA